jgi:ATP-dependent Lon protease
MMKNSSENPAREEDKEAQGAEAEPNTAEKRLPEFINLLPMTYLNSFPGLNSAISVDESLSRQIVEDSWNKGEMMALFALKGAEADPANLKTEEFYETGVAVKITDVAPAESGLLKAYVKGICRVRMTGVINGEIPLARVDEVPEDPADANDPELVPLMFEAKRLYTEIVSLMPGAPADPFKAVRMLDESPGLLADLLLAALPLNPKEKAEYFLIRGVKARFEALIGHLSEERAKRQVGAALSKKIQEGIEKRQKEMFLREHLKAIRDELGEGEEGAGENQKLFERVAALPLPPEARAAADREAERLKATPSSSAEHAGIRNWLEWIADLPWGDSTPAIGSVGRAREILERDHYGMEKVKKRVLEFLAVHQLTAETAKTPVLCLTGPPGVGKTSLARSIAEATGRKFTRLSLGGVRDESEIRGHRRTYVGARPGRLIAGLKKAGSDNPVFLLDELDKMGHGYQGDPAAALLEALDPEQNETFTDSYLEVPFDLSKVLFVLTANVLENIPAPLRDRLEVVELSGYTENEKAEIALRHIWPRELKRHGLEEGELSVSKEVLSELISGWTSEAGCRGLARGLSAVIRSRAVLKAEGLPFERDFPASDLASALGPPRRRPEKAADSAQVGVVTGLAWTAAGGDLMFVEAISMPGSG